ncbi:MAG: T9SS type A sorting domain-containing protein [candidate division Zixibacteria bacterium]|nr:T9SS type A sorting domain-containing protein [candidate division Zixibacteria bacterium]
MIYRCIILACIFFCAVLIGSPVSFCNNLPDNSPFQRLYLQGGDTIEDATIIPGIPYFAIGTTENYTDDYDVWWCVGANSPDVVYAYIPIDDQTIDISLCDSTEYDSGLYIFENVAGNDIACSDDACSTPLYPIASVSRINCLRVYAGSTYYIVIDGKGGDYGSYSIRIEMSPEPCGDIIEDPFVIAQLPFADFGNTCEFMNNYDEQCPFGGTLAQDVVYAYSTTYDMTAVISLCSGSDYDTKVYVYENLYTPGNYYACNDDHCSTPNYPDPYVSKLENIFLTGGNTYFIVVDGYGEECGNYTLDIFEMLCCDVDMIPDDDPVIVPPGGSFGLTGYIGNPTPDPIITDVWGGVLYQGNFYRQFAFNNISLDPGESMTAHTTQNVPNWAPAGSYDYIAYCGDRPDTKCDSASFPFTVTGARLANGATEWSIEGGFFGEELIPTEFALDNAYPNPFNATATISYRLPVASSVNLDIYNVLGQRVTTLVNGNVEAGYHSVNWDASNYSSGVYFYKLKIGDKVITKRMTLLK